MSKTFTTLYKIQQERTGTDKGTVPASQGTVPVTTSTQATALVVAFIILALLSINVAFFYTTKRADLKVAATMAEMREVERLLARSNHEIDSLSSNITQLSNDLSRMNRTVESQNQALVSLKEEKEATQVTLARLVKDKHALLEKISSLESKFQDLANGSLALANSRPTGRELIPYASDAND